MMVGPSLYEGTAALACTWLPWTVHGLTSAEVLDPAGTTEAVLSASPPPLPADDLYYEVVEARVGEGLYFSRGGQKISFGDTPQVKDRFSALSHESHTWLV